MVHKFILALALTLTLLIGAYAGNRRPLKSQSPPITINSSVPRTTKPLIVLYTTSGCSNCRVWETALYRALFGLHQYVTFTPQFYFQKTNDLTSYCLSTQLDPSLCPKIYSYYGYNSVDSCRTGLQQKFTSCLDPRNYLTFPSSNNTYYTSRSRTVASQNLRFLCAKTLLSSQTWWQFYLSTVNSCDPSDFDTCWPQKLTELSENPNLVVTCFNNQSQSLLKNQLDFINKNPHLSLPSLLINGSPVELTQDLANPVALRSIICNSFINPPAACEP
ncbi:MAG: hypothetical protein WCT01_00600 [Candidatus Shapirobacteria bacterium]